jgi:hypothetical protein
MANHAKGCEFQKYHRILTSIDPNGPDEQIKITDDGIEFHGNLHASHPNDEVIYFNFCPMCGTKY